MASFWADDVPKERRITYQGHFRKVDKKPWRPGEDAALVSLVNEYGAVAKWTTIAARLGSRTGKQCRERYLNHLNPNIKKGGWSKQEDDNIISLHESLGNHWCKYTDHLPGRTDCAIKNRFHVLTRGSVKKGKQGSEDSEQKPGKKKKGEKAALGDSSHDSTNSREEEEEEEEEMMMADENRLPIMGSSDFMNLSSRSNADVPLSIEIPPADPMLNDLEQEFVDLYQSPREHRSGSSQSTQPVFYNPPNTYGSLASLAGLFNIESFSADPRAQNMEGSSSSMILSPPRLRHKQQGENSSNTPFHNQPLFLKGPTLSSPLASLSSQHWFNLSPLQHQVQPSSSTSPLTPLMYAFEPSPSPFPAAKRQKVSYPYNYVSPRKKVENKGQVSVVEAGMEAKEEGK